ncbi:MAG: tetratricopeptide repeat protein [Rhodospirillaceae bacterium]
MSALKTQPPKKFTPAAGKTATAIHVPPTKEESGKNRADRRAEAGKFPPKIQEFIDTFNLGLQAQTAKNLPLAEQYYRKAMEMNPNDAMLLNNFGVCQYEQGKTEEAVEIHRKAIKLDPTRPMAYNNLGVELNALERHEEALAAFEKAVQIQPINPKAINNWGDSLTKLGRFDEALAMLQKSIEQEPDYVDAHSNMGMALWGLARFDEAIQSLRRALSYRIDHPSVRKNLGLVLLLMQEWGSAWEEYEWRWVADKLVQRSKRPRWCGEDLTGKTMLVWSEQGLGDEVLHMSMAEDLLKRGCKVVWECDYRLVKLLERTYPQMTVVPRKGLAPPLPATQTDDIVVQSPSASLGRFLRKDAKQFPQGRPHYLKLKPAKVAMMRQAMNVKPGERLVGISWVSKNRTIGSNKTIDLIQWKEILSTPGIRFVDLQYGDTRQERAEFAKQTGLNLEHLNGLDLTEDIDGLASLIGACDLVITVSNTTAHIAGAVGVPVWVLLPAKLGKFWYWGHEGKRTLWYDSARIIRQSHTEAQDWGPTLRTTAARLRSALGLE